MISMSACAAAVGMAGGTTAASGDLTMPAEWHPHEGCVMAFSAAKGAYTVREINAIHIEQAAIAKAIQQFEPVTMLVNAEDKTKARGLLGAHIEIVEMTHFDVWTRDTLPSICLDTQGAPVAVNWNFNVWGEKFQGYDADRDLAERFAADFEYPSVRADIVIEGGAIEVDGENTLLTTETCLMNKNRNPGWSAKDIEDELRRLTGATKVIWLYGSDADAITDGHIDGIARFVAPGVVVTEITDDSDDPEYRDLLENARRLDHARDSRGRRLEVFRLKRPRWDVMGERGDDFAASYVNSYFANGGIVMPAFGDRQRDQAAHDLFAQLMPYRKIVQLRVDEICEGGGGIHCNTQHLPTV